MPSAEPLAPEIEKKCRWCASNIPQQALICKECKSDQLLWVFFIRWLAGVSSVLALLGAAITFIAANWQEVSKRFFWRDSISLVQVDAVPGLNTTAVLSNTGDGPVFVSVITIYWRGGNYAFLFQKVIQPRDISVVTVKKEYSQSYGFLASETGIPTDAVLQSTAIYAQDENECFLAHFYNVDAPNLARMNYSLTKRTLVTDSAKIEVHYHSLHDGKVIVAGFDAVTTFLTREKPGCEAIK
jgi:hypothetical protein